MGEIYHYVIIHHNDLDGRCGAAVLRRYLHSRGVGIPYDKILLIEMDYKDTLSTDEIADGAEIYIVDFSLKPEVMKQLVETRQPEKIIWLDHHATARDYLKDYPVLDVNLVTYCDFVDKSRSGCELAWDWCYPDTPAPEVVKLIGDYDKWAMKYTPECRCFYEGMKMINAGESALHPDWDYLLSISITAPNDAIQELVGRGRAAIDYRDAYCNDIRRSFGYETLFERMDCYAMNVYRFGSAQFGPMLQAHPVCIAYIHDGKRFTVSLYSENPHIDCGVLAKKYGGGGHKGAAGFVCEALPFKRKEGES